MSKNKKHYYFMAAVMVLIDVVINVRFDIHNGWVLFMACFWGAIAGAYIYAAITSK